VPDSGERLIATVQGQLRDLRDEARDRAQEARREQIERHSENRDKLERIEKRLEIVSSRIDLLERWKAWLLGAWAAGMAFVLLLWAVAKEWRPWGK
jgi:hypothetical protein